tara:strand:- start:1931 stop:3457 length:1527 start_codon:yes stop_codon:yes gene_type:complete
MIFYTSITNGYDKLSPPPISDVKFICFYDGDKPSTDGWEYRKIGIDEECPVRKSYHPKHCPQLYFPPYTVTVWIDAAYAITNELVEYSKILLDKHDFVLQRHPDNRTLIEEYEKLYYHGFSTREEIIDMCKRIKNIKFPVKFYDQTINCVIWRRLTPKVTEWCKVWREWYDIGVNRDQVSSSIAEFLVVKAHRVDLAVDMTKSTRVKSYGESYKLHESTGDIVDSIRKILPVEKKTFSTNTFTDVSDIIIYTCITNGYDNLVSDFYHPNVRYVCFHDGTIDTSITPWEYIKLDVDISCPRRLSFYPKANPHLFFPNGSKTIWIDACYKHTPQFLSMSRDCFPFTILRHPSKFTYYDEILEGFMCAFFSYNDAINLTKKLKEKGYDFKKYSSPLGTILWRTISPEINRFNDLWYKWSLIGCNRDQIALDIALKESDVLPSIIENREETGIPLGYNNKFGRKGKHPQRGDLQQFHRKNELLQELKEITGLHPKLYTKHNHEFMMSESGVL